MHIDWASLARVGVVAAAVAVTVVLLVAFALVALSNRPRQPVDGPDRDQPSRAHSGVGTAVATLCLLAAGLIVVYGLHLIIG
jgi:hypothetical protein